MIIKLFEISKEFFELIYPPIVEDTFENDKEKLDEENGLEEVSDDEEYEEEICGCNLCHIMHQLILFINPEIYKKLNSNKID
jgi:hypothetical protein